MMRFNQCKAQDVRFLKGPGWHAIAVVHLQDPGNTSWAIEGVLLQNGIHQNGPSGKALPTAQVQPARVEVLVHIHHGEDALTVERLHKHHQTASLRNMQHQSSLQDLDERNSSGAADASTVLHI